MSTLSRRTVLASLAALPVAAAARDRLIINGLGDVGDSNLATFARIYPGLKLNDGGDLVTDRVWKDLRASGLNAVNVTLGYVAGPADPFESTVADIGTWDRLVRANPGKLIKIYSSADIIEAKRSGRVGLIYGFQNSVQIGSKAERVDLYADLGLRV